MRTLHTSGGSEVTERPKTCPKCRLLNEPHAAVCDCGYDFASKTVRPPALQASPKRLNAELDNLIDGAQAYRSLLWLVLVQLVCGIASRIAYRGARQDPNFAMSAF